MTSLSLHVTAPSNMKFSLYFWSFDYNSRLKGRYQRVRQLIFYLLPALVYERSFREMAFHSSSPPPENEKSLPTEMKALVVTIFVTITIISIFGNTMVIRAFYKFSNLRNAANVIVVSLSVAGISMSVPFILHIATILVGKKVPPHQLCAPASIINLTLIGIVILHLTLISVERFVAVKFAMTYHTIVTNRRTVIASTVAWLWGVCAVNAFPEAFKATDKVFGGYHAGLTPCLPQFPILILRTLLRRTCFFWWYQRYSCPLWLSLHHTVTYSKSLGNSDDRSMKRSMESWPEDHTKWKVLIQWPLLWGHVSSVSFRWLLSCASNSWVQHRLERNTCTQCI